MSPLIFLGIALFFVLNMYGRRKETEAADLLTAERRAELQRTESTPFMARPQASMFVILGGAVGYALLKREFPEAFWPAVLFVGLLVGYVAYRTKTDLEKLVKLKAPDAVRQGLLVGRGMRVAGLLALGIMAIVNN